MQDVRADIRKGKNKSYTHAEQLLLRQRMTFMAAENPGGATVRVSDINGVDVPRTMAPVSRNIFADIREPARTPVTAGVSLLGKSSAEG